jgi:hypothetical protein
MSDMTTATHLQNPVSHINSNQPVIWSTRNDGATRWWVVADFTIALSAPVRRQNIPGAVEYRVLLMAAEQDLDTNSSGANREELRRRETHASSRRETLAALAVAMTVRTTKTDTIIY